MIMLPFLVKNGWTSHHGRPQGWSVFYWWSFAVSDAWVSVIIVGMAGHSFNKRLPAPKLLIIILEPYFGENLDWVSIFAGNLRDDVHFSTATLFLVYFDIIFQHLHFAQTRRAEPWHSRTAHTRLFLPYAALGVQLGKRMKHFWARPSKPFYALIDFDGNSEVCLRRKNLLRLFGEQIGDKFGVATLWWRY